jgi:hypothetical protein
MPYADLTRRREYHRLYMRSYLLLHPQQYTATQRAHRKAAMKKRDAMRSQRGDHLKERYGVSLQEFDAKLAAQGGHCVFCAATIEKSGCRLSLDHDKRTGRFRGVLCRRHNSALGTFGDTAEALLRAVAYLRGEHV